MPMQSRLAQFEDSWTTSIGAAVGQEFVMFRDRKLHHDFKDASWFELYLHGITGRSFSDAELRVLNAMWTYTSYPDPRIWNNRVAALAGTVRSTAGLAVGAAIGVSEAEIYGAKPIYVALETLQQAREWVQTGKPLDEFLTHELRRWRKIAGFGRPKALGDERIEPLLDLMAHVGYPRGPYVELAFAIDRFLHSGRWRFKMNYAGLVAAVCGDMGFTPKQAFLYSIAGLLAGFLPCFMDATEHPLGSFFPMRCDRIHYHGPAPRSWNHPE